MRKKNTGFTLLEVILALAVLASVMVISTQSFIGSYRRVRKAKVNGDMVNLLRLKAAEVELSYKDKPDQLPEDPKTGDFGEDYKNFSYEWIAQEMVTPDFSSTLTQGDGAPEQLVKIFQQFEKHTQESIYEVKVSVLYTVKKKTQKRSVYFYIVDYNKVFQPSL